MFRRKVTSPDGRKWTLGRHWMPRRRTLGRAKLRDLDAPDFLPDFGDDLGVIGVIILGFVAIIVGVLLILVIFNVFAIAIELLLVLVLLLWGVLARVVFRRPWTVFAKSGTTLYTRQIVGWRASRRAIEEIEQDLRSGVQLQAPAGHGG
jgi:hypothetical protein